MKFTVFVDDNFHYMDESERYKHGEYETSKAAVAAAQKIVNRSLRELHTWSMSAGELTKLYCSFGEDPYIYPSDPAVEFSARDYARERAQEMCSSSFVGRLAAFFGSRKKP